MRTMTTRKGRTINTDLSDAEAIEIIRGLAGDFARSLVRQHAEAIMGDAARYHGVAPRRGLSPDQIAWVHILAIEARDKARAAATKTAPAPDADAIPLDDVSRIFGLFGNVGSKLKYPKLRFKFAHRPVVLSPAGAGSRHAGCLYVSNGQGRDTNVFYGRITDAGMFIPSRRGLELMALDDAGDDGGIIGLLVSLATDPAAFLAAHGRASGHCCYCGLPLDDERSTAAGYGPVCAKHWGLPWGTEGKAARKARVKRTEAPAPFVPAGGLDDEPDSHFDEMALASVGRDAGWY